MFQVYLESEIYGSEAFEYSSVDELKAGVGRLIDDVLRQRDGVERQLVIQLLPLSRKKSHLLAIHKSPTN